MTRHKKGTAFPRMFLVDELPKLALMIQSSIFNLDLAVTKLQIFNSKARFSCVIQDPF